MPLQLHTVDPTPQLMGIMAIDIHLGRRPMNDHGLPLARLSGWKWLGGLGYSPVRRMRVLSCRGAP
jgi:hypothetical protein